MLKYESVSECLLPVWVIYMTMYIFMISKLFLQHELKAYRIRGILPLAQKKQNRNYKKALLYGN